MGKRGTSRQATDDDIILRVPIISWMTEATNTHPEYVTPIAFPGKRA